MSTTTTLEPVAQIQSFAIYAEMGDQRTEIQKNDIVTLTLPLEDAELLHDVLRQIGGYPNGTRGRTNAIREALVDAGVDYDDERDALTGSLTFNDGSPGFPSFLHDLRSGAIY